LANLSGQKRGQIANGKPIGIAFRLGARNHCRREIDAHEPPGKGTEHLPGQPGATAQIKERSKMRRLAHALARRCHRIAKQRRSAIVQVLDQRSVITASILVEQPPQIGLGHRRYLRAGAEARQLQPRAVIIFRVGVARCTKGGHGGIAIAEPVADGAERKPGGGETGRSFDGLRQNIRCGGKIAARGELDRGLVPAITDEVAGRYKQWASVGHAALLERRTGIDDEAQRDSSSLVSH